VHFSVEHEGVAQSQDLADLAADIGDETAGAENDIVARIDAASNARAGQELEVWFDPEKLHLFDSDSGQSLTYREGNGAGAAPPPTTAPAGA
jgi:multiple sugar transport system ATP-binding protein